MPKNQFALPSISPLIGSTRSVFDQTLQGNEVADQYKHVERNTRIIVSALSPFRAFERAVTDKRADGIEPEHLVFIIGHWRSGTTFLHNLMCQANNASFVSTYQTVFSNCMGTQSIIKPLMKAVMPNRRPADNMRLEADLPQEEEFAFSNVDPHTYYRFMYFPKNYDRFYREAIHLEGLTEIQKQNFVKSYKRIISKALLHRPGQIMIIKNPVNTARLKWLKEHFPKAKYIHIYRNPNDVYRSTLRFFSALIPTLWFHEVSDDFFSSMIFDIYKRMYRDYDEARNSINDMDIVDIRYEDFVMDPMTHLEQIYSHLNLPGMDESKIHFEQYVQAKQAYSAKSYTHSSGELKLIDEKLGEFKERWEYR